MFLINTKNMEAFKEAKIQRFKEKCDAFLKLNFVDWYDKSSKIKRMILIDSVIEFGEKYEIRKEISLQKLLVMELENELLKKEFEAEIQELLWQTFKKEENKIKVLEGVLSDLTES